MPRWVVKLLVLVGTFLLPLICTLLPYKVSGYISRRGASGKRMLSYLMCLGGGVFFGTYLLHMGPEVQTILKESLLDPYGITYPVAELMVGVGFFIVLFAEKIVLRWNKKRIHRKRKESRHLTKLPKLPSVSLTVEQLPSDRSKCARPLSEQMCDECLQGKQCSGFSGKKHGHTEAEDVHQNADSQEQQSTDIDASSHLLSKPGADAKGESYADPSSPNQDPSQKDKQIIVTMSVDDSLNRSTSKEFDVETVSVGTPGSHHHATRSLILILALSLHRIFEGMGIGLQQTVTSVVNLFGAVMCHETVIGFSLGLQFVRSGFALRRLLITSFVCSVIMPLGVLIGIAMTEIESSSGNVDIANGILQAIAMGTFIYVTFFEILQEEVDADDTSLGKIICIAIGFAIMALLTLIPEEVTVTTGTGNSYMSTVVPPANATFG